MAIGIDIEKTGAVKEELWPLVMGDVELAWLDKLPPSEREQYATVVFSAKESFYKLQYPLTRSWLEFRDVEVSVYTSGLFSVKILKPLKNLLNLQRSCGKYLFDNNVTITAMHLASPTIPISGSKSMTI